MERLRRRDILDAMRIKDIKECTMVKITKGMKGFVEVTSGHLGAADYLREDQVDALRKFVEKTRKGRTDFKIMYCEWMDDVFYVSFRYGDEYEVGDGFVDKEDYPALYQWNADQWESSRAAFHAD